MSKLYDLIIIGSGSAGMTAGIYAGRARLKTLVIDKDQPGGQIKITAEVANYPGIPNISGAELSKAMRKQAEGFGAAFISADVLSVDFSGNIKRVVTSEGTFEALSVIIATGATPRTLGFAGEEEFRGRGIGYCATCDGEFFTGMDVFVVGAGFAAAEEAIFLTRYARKVTVIAREPEFTCSKSIADKVLAHPKIEVKFNTEVVRVGGERLLEYAEFVNNQTGETQRYEVSGGDLSFGMFIFVGYIPQTALFAGQITLDRAGYIPADESMKTGAPGVFAAGDVRAKSLRQLVTAVSDGAVAATEAERYVAEKKAQLGIAEEDGHDEHAQSEHAAPATAPGASFFDEELKAQLAPVLERLERAVTLTAIMDTGSEIHAELRAFLDDFAALTPKVRLRYLNKGEEPDTERAMNVTIFPAVALSREDGSYTGIQFHGIPGGHEINSFILTVYNTAGPGQQLEEGTRAQIASIARPVNIKIGVSLSCTLCPDVVALAQLMAVHNPNVEAEMVDVARFPDFKSRYGIMSVPAIVVNDDKVHFGKKDIDALIALAKG